MKKIQPIKARVPQFLTSNALLLVLLFAGALLPAAARAATTLSQGYTTTDKVAVGSIVSLKDNSTDEVEAATTKNIDNIFGVVIDDGNSLLALSSGKSNQIQVATNGVVQVLVSSINGDILKGDQITASPISGVGMKATDNTKVIGISQADLSGNNAAEQTYTDKNNQKHTIKIGTVPVIVSVGYFFKQPEKTLIPTAIQNIANALAGKAVKPLPILISFAIFVIAVVAVATIIFSMIRNSIISVGRNPMAQSAVYRNLIQISILVPIILGVALGAIYLILAKF